MDGTYAAIAALVIGLAPGAAQDASAPAHAKQETAPAVTLGAANVEKLAKMVRGYYALCDQELLGKAKKELDKLVDELGKIGKAQKIAEPMLALEDWREIVKRGSQLEKPTVNISWRVDLKLATLTEEQTLVKSNADPKDLQGIFDNKLKAFVSVPVDFAKVAYPVIVALHPLDAEVKSLKEMKKSSKIIEEVGKWAEATYSKELRSKAIVLVPVMDLTLRSADQVSYMRPRWDSDEGAAWVFRALSQIIFPNVNYDPRRIFLDGHGSGAQAALLFAAQFPGLQTGCIARGEPPQKIDFENCVGTPIMFVGAASQSFYDEWKGKEGFVLDLPVDREKAVGADGVEREQVTPKAALDDATFLQWMTDHPKTFAPHRIRLRTERFEFASSHWFRVTEEDASKDKLPIIVDAVADRDKNVITIVTNEKVKRFEVYLNDDLVDLSKEVRILHRRTGGETDSPEVERFKGVLRRVLEDTLRWAYDRPYCNTGEIYMACVPVTLD